MLTARDLGIMARRAMDLPERPDYPMETRIVSTEGKNCQKWEIVPELFPQLVELKRSAGTVLESDDQLSDQNAVCRNTCCMYCCRSRQHADCEEAVDHYPTRFCRLRGPRDHASCLCQRCADEREEMRIYWARQEREIRFYAPYGGKGRRPDVNILTPNLDRTLDEVIRDNRRDTNQKGKGKKGQGKGKKGKGQTNGQGKTQGRGHKGKWSWPAVAVGAAWNLQGCSQGDEVLEMSLQTDQSLKSLRQSP